MAGHPVKFAVEPPPSPRNRLTVAFRPILALPHILMVGGPLVGMGWSAARMGALGLVAAAAAFIDWFAILFTGKALPGLLEQQRFYLRWRARALAYQAMLRDEYPPFGDGDYPAAIDTPAIVQGRNRLTVGFRLLLAIPHAVVLAVLLLAWTVTAIIGWFSVLITGRYPEDLWRFGHEVMAWNLRFEAYVLLMHDEYPPFVLALDQEGLPERRTPLTA